MGYPCTCARAHRASVSHKRLGRLYSNLVCGFRVIPEVLSTSHGLGISARAHVQTALLYLRKGLGRLSSILVCELGVMNYVLNTIHGWGISAGAHVHTALLYHRNGLTDCVQIWYVGWRSLNKCFPQVMGGVGYLCTCARAPHLRNGLTDCVQIWYVGWRSLNKCFPQVMGGVGYLCTCARAPPPPYLRIRVAN